MFNPAQPPPDAHPPEDHAGDAPPPPLQAADSSLEGTSPAQETDGAAPQPLTPEQTADQASQPVPPAEPDEAQDSSSNPPSEPAAVPPTGQPRRSLAYRLFSPETRTGRFMRPVLRWLAAITGLFALGLLAAYFLLYQPTQKKLDATAADLAAANQTLQQREQSLQTAQSSLKDAQTALNQSQEQLTLAAGENSLLLVMVEVGAARVALVEKDGAAAKTAVAQAQANLALALPVLEKEDKLLSELLKSRLDLINKELVSDPQAAQSDLGKLAQDLAALRKKIFGH